MSDSLSYRNHENGVNLLRVQVEMRAIDLVEPPEQVFCRPVHVIPARVIGEIIAQGRLGQFRSEEVDFVKEENDGGTHEPSRVDDGVKENERFHHAVLRRVSRNARMAYGRVSLPDCSLLGEPGRTR